MDGVIREIFGEGPEAIFMAAIFGDIFLIEFQYSTL